MRVAGVVLAAMMLVAGAAQAAEERVFRDWIATCNNVSDCVLFGTQDSNVEGDIGYVRFAQAYAVPSQVRASLVTIPEDGRVRNVMLAVRVDGRTVPGLAAVTFTAFDDIGMRARLSQAQSNALLAAVRNGRALTLVEGNRTRATISLAGSAAALLWVDEQQQRVGTAGALARPGRRPLAVRGMRTAPVVRAAPSVPQTNLPTIATAPLRRQMTDCDDDIIATDIPSETYRLDPDTLLVTVPCSRGAYNVSVALFLTDGRGRNPRPVSLRLPPGSETATEDLPTNLTYDPVNQTISSFPRGRGLGDCGTDTTWAWTGTAFELRSQFVMGECKGIMRDDWPSLYVSRPAAVAAPPRLDALPSPTAPK